MNTCPEVPEYFLSKVFTPHIVNDDLMIRKELCVEDDDITITINAFVQVMSVVFPRLRGSWSQVEFVFCWLYLWLRQYCQIFCSINYAFSILVSAIMYMCLSD